MVVGKGWGEWGNAERLAVRVCSDVIRNFRCAMVQLGTIADKSVSEFAFIYLQRTV